MSAEVSDARMGVAVSGGGSPQTDVERKVAFLEEMARQLAREGNLIESVKARETALHLMKRRNGEQTAHPSVEHLVADCNARGMKRFKSDEDNSTSADQGHKLVVALHNLGAAQEVCDDPVEARKAFTTFSQAAQVAHSELGPDHPSTAIVEQSLHRFRTVVAPQRGLTLGEGSVPAMPAIGRSNSVTSTPVHVPQLLESSEGGSPGGSDRRPAPPPLKPAKRAPRQTVRQGKGQLLDYASSPTSEAVSQQPEAPSGSRAGKAPRRGGGGVAEPVGLKGHPAVGAPATAMRSDTQRHAQRMLQKKNRDELRFNEEDRRRQVARRLYEKEQRAKAKREQEIERKKREEMARLMYENMCAALRADEIRRYRTAARNIQRVWRGVMARTMIRKWESAAIKVQSVVRSHQCRLFQRMRRDQIARSQAEAHHHALRDKASRIIQRRARFLFAQKSLNRIRHAKELRRWHSARIIQRGWGVYRRAIERELLLKEEQLRLNELIRQKQLNAAARKIQRWWRTSQQRMAIQTARAEMDNQSVAALAIQRLYRGGVTRTAMRRIKLLHTATGREKRMDKASPLIQRATRCFLARRHVERARALKVYNERTSELERASRVIQRSYRCYRAKKRSAELKELKSTLNHQALAIQRHFRGYLARASAEQKRHDKRACPAATIIQTAWRTYIIHKKKSETVVFHMKLKQQQREAERRTRAAMLLQSWYRGCQGRLIASEYKAANRRRVSAVCVLQRAVRCYLAIKHTKKLNHLRGIVEEQERLDREQRQAAIVIQRHIRGKLARLLQRRMRLEVKNAVIIQGFFRCCKAKRTLADLKDHRDLKEQLQCLILIQRRVRRWLSQRELQRLEDYYNGKRREKLLESRREEAVMTVQCAWRQSLARMRARNRRDELQQRTAPVIIIQRCWRARKFRREIEAEVTERVETSTRRNDAARRLQTFWRMVVAQEYTQMLREEREIQMDAAIHLQCWWRQIHAKKVVRVRRAAKETATVTARIEAERFEHCLCLTQAAARSVIAQLHRNRLIVAYVNRQIEAQTTYALSIQYGAAVTIQAVYRGHSDRLYVKGVRRERREAEDLRKKVLRQREEGALTIQLFVRSSFARERASVLRQEHKARVAKEMDEYELHEKPSELVRQLFWEMEAQRGVTVLRDSAERKQRRDAAAVKIQCVIRSAIAHLRVKALRQQRKRVEAALVIQKAWSLKKLRLDCVHNETRAAAATRIQSLQRGRVARAHANALRSTTAEEMQKSLELEQAMDSAVVLIQSFWRLVVARRVAAQMSQDLQEMGDVHRMHEGATFIQKVYRGYRGRKLAAKTRHLRRTKQEETHNRKYFLANSDCTQFGGPHVGSRIYSAQEREDAALRLQCWFRVLAAKECCRKTKAETEKFREDMRKDEAAAIIQGAWRRPP